MNAIIRSTLLIMTMLSPPLTALAETIELRMSWWGGNQRHQATRLALDAFEQAYPGIKVRSEPGGFDGQLQRLATQVAGNSEPDVMQINWNWLPVFSKTGDGFYDLNKLDKDIDLSQFSERAKSMAVREGRLNGVPVSLTARLFYYNAEPWKKAGLSYPTTWDELFAAGKVFKEKLGEDYYPLSIYPNSEIVAILNTYMVQKYNIPMVDEEKKKFNYSKEQWLDFFGFYKRLIDEHVIPPAVSYYASFGKSNPWEVRPWMNGQLGGKYLWTTDGIYAPNLKNPADYVLGPFIKLPGAKESGLFFKPGLIFSIGKNTRHVKEAAQLVNFLLNDPRGVTAMGLHRGIPLSEKAVQILQQEKMVDADNLQLKSLQQMEGLVGKIDVSTFLEDAKFQSLMTTYIERLEQGKISLDEIATAFPKEAERLLRRFF
ncbi:ABC transporter substrate-binding protein [Brenneria tiliae]|uniref:ABC transporter substrate-binding protein n=1 Tax=Brenneria tiliae TaxID=2914984 RepID=UPI0020149047|nr:ABC transporter substrate-binding protein [Brenneria tiliae]MCL2898727.1 ABC transporter substrate-binding protein [Brenneria tiliae]MCL2903336.1 ABC transporter substrate-binding protein [Brenneria tiliae]